MSSTPVLPCQLSAVGTALESQFTDVTEIQRMTAGAIIPDGAGGYMIGSGTGWTTVATVTGLLTTTRFGSAREALTTDQVAAAVNYKWYGPADTDVRQQDRLVIGSRTFEVRGIALDTSGMPLEALLTELQRGQAIV